LFHSFFFCYLEIIMKVAQIIIASTLFAAAAGAQAAGYDGKEDFSSPAQTTVSRAEVVAQARAAQAERAQRGYVAETGEYRQAPASQAAANAQGKDRADVRAEARQPRTVAQRELYIG
jgi:hypothetical protein